MTLYGKVSTVVNDVSLGIVATSNLLTLGASTGLEPLPTSCTSIKSPTFKSERNPVLVPFTVDEPAVTLTLPVS